MKLHNAVIILLAGQVYLHAEAIPSAVSSAGCDPAIADARGDATILCHGLNDDQVRTLPKVSSILDALLKKDAKAPHFEAQLDGILNFVENGAPLGLPVAAVVPTVPAVLGKPEIASPGVSKPEVPKEIITYDYRGNKISSLKGPFPGDLGEAQQYEKMITLQKEGDWKKLLKESTREIKKVPDWLTPYAFKGVALVRLGKKEEAISALEYVVDHSAGNPDYDKVRHMLKQLKP